MVNFLTRVISALLLFTPHMPQLSETNSTLGVLHAIPGAYDTSYRLYLNNDLKTVHLINAQGRYIHSWFGSEDSTKENWVFADLADNGELHVLLESQNVITLDWKSELLGEKKAPAALLMKSSNPSTRLFNGNFLVIDINTGYIKELNPEGETVWEYVNPDRDTLDRPIPITRVSAYDESSVTILTEKFSQPPALTTREVKQRSRSISLEGQYKKLIRDAITEIEAGYLDEAHKYLLSYVGANPDDLEGLFAMSVLYTRRRDLRRAMEYAQKAIEGGLPVGRFLAGLGHLLDPLLEYKEFQILASKYRQNAIIHGPMVGNVSGYFAEVWLRTEAEVEVQIQVYEGDETIFTSVPEHTSEEDNYTARITVSGLLPKTTYDYAILINGHKLNETYKLTTFPEKGQPASFTLAFSGGAGYTPQYERMWDTLTKQHPLAFLFMGDNIYIDHPERPLTQEYCYFRRQSRVEYRRFVSQTAIYAIWDDHDFTYNDSYGGPEVNEPYWKRNVLDLFQQNWINPYYGLNRKNPGCYFDFSIGQVDFFMLDGRFYREEPTGDDKSMLGKVQKEWLKEKLKGSTATFKVIASSVPWAPGTKPGSRDTWDGHPEEREEIFNFLKENQIEGVILLSGDRHRSDAWVIHREGAYPLYDFMSSRLTNVHTHERVPGALFSYNKTPAFGTLEFDTQREDPQLIYRIISIENEEIHRMTLYKSQLSHD